MPKPGGKDGKLYKIVKETVIEGDIDTVLEESGFYRILAVGSSSSLPQPSSEAISKGARALAAGDVVHLWKGQGLAGGDKVALLELVLISFVKDVSNSKQGTSVDISTQENVDSGTREFAVGAFTDSSGSITGTVETNSDAQRELLNQFTAVMEDDGTNINIYPAKQTKQDYMMSRRETNIVGETAMWEHFPVIVESIQMDKPLDGEQNFNFNYKVDGGNHPGMIYYKVKEVA